MAGLTSSALEESPVLTKDTFSLMWQVFFFASTTKLICKLILKELGKVLKCCWVRCLLDSQHFLSRASELLAATCDCLASNSWLHAISPSESE